ncbi:DUF1461 domain-containing protein [Candidatus Woesearchaeota archaeon]|nr:DUF1461 domain-containing protein [Candidatus Woesearchaeota archaeon]
MKTINIFKTVLIFIFILILSFQIVATSKFFYKLNLKDYQKNESAILNVINYLNYKQELDKNLFNDKEILHLKDIFNIFLILKLIFIVSFIIFLFLIFKDFECLLKPFLYSLILTIIISLILYVINFNSLFLNFHKLIFFNDYWLLDPSKDILIRLFPQEFFQNSLYSILILNLAFHLIFITVLSLKNRKTL